MLTKKIQLPEPDALSLPLDSYDIESLTKAILEASQSLSETSDSLEAHKNPAVQKLAQLIRCSSLHMAPFINEMITKVTTERQENSAKANFQAVYDFRQEMECILGNFTYLARAKNIDISLSMPADIEIVFCNLDSLRIHVFNNILSNAIQHTPDGGEIAIVVEVKDSQILIIKISDTGIGIPTSERERMLQNSTSGSGLYSAQQCVRAHNGRISIIDNPNYSGATFKIDIPLYDKNSTVCRMPAR